MQKSWRTYFEKKNIKPTVTHKDKDGKIIAYTYELPKDWNMKKPAPKKQMSEEAKKKAAERMKKMQSKE